MILSFPVVISAQALADTLSSTSLQREDSATTKVVRLKINSAKSDFSPFVFNDQLLFVSGRDKKGTVQYVDLNNGTEITDIYTSGKVDSLKYKPARPFNDVINTKYNEGPFCFNTAGNIIYFTSSDKITGILKICQSQKINDQWSKPEPLPFCQNKVSYCHPCLSPKEDYMIFSAKDTAGNNKMDLYISEYNNGIWSSPVALDKRINDSSNQVFPFISQNNVLYFSSDKNGGLGGLDIYCISLNSDTSVVRALSLPFNSRADDFGVWFSTDSKSGYLSSDRVPSYKDDIYYFTKSMPDFSDWKKITKKNNFCYTFYEETTLSTSDTLNLTYEWDFGDGSKGRGLKAKHCFRSTGDYDVQLNIIDKNSGEVFVNQTATKLTIERTDELVIACNDTVFAGNCVLMTSKNCYLKGCELTDMYWSFGDGRYNTGPNVTHIYKVPGRYKIEMGLVAKDLISNKKEQFKIEKNIVVLNK